MVAARRTWLLSAWNGAILHCSVKYNTHTEFWRLHAQNNVKRLISLFVWITCWSDTILIHWVKENVLLELVSPVFFLLFTKVVIRTFRIISTTCTVSIGQSCSVHIEMLVYRSSSPFIYPNGDISGIIASRRNTQARLWFVHCWVLPGSPTGQSWISMGWVAGRVPCWPWARSPGSLVPSQAGASGPRCHLGISVAFSHPNSDLSF